MTIHREEASLTIRIELSASFDGSYEGEDDGYEWLTRFRGAVQPRVLRAVMEALRSDPSFDVVPVSRGRSPDENFDVEVRLRTADAAASGKLG